GGRGVAPGPGPPDRRRPGSDPPALPGGAAVRRDRPADGAQRERRAETLAAGGGTTSTGVAGTPMTAADGPLDDRFLAERADRAAGLAPARRAASSPICDRAPPLDARRERARACLERLHRLRPGRKSDTDLAAGGSHGPAGQKLGRFQIVRELGRGG